VDQIPTAQTDVSRRIQDCWKPVSRGDARLTDEKDPGASVDLPSQQAPSTGAQPPRLWGRPDRNHLLIWVGIAFILPGLTTLALRPWLKISGVSFNVSTELALKGMFAFFVVLATWIVSRLEKRPLDDYGIPPRQILGINFWEGAVWGFVMLSMIVLVLRWSGHFQIDSVALSGGALSRYAAGWGAVFLAVAVSEELAFRGYWLFALARFRGFWRAALITSLVFGLAHLGNPGENVLGILQVVLIGLLFCLTLRRTGTLWFALGFHAAWDWAETFFYGTPDSGLIGVGHYLNTSVQGPRWLTGGSAGPEGSVLAVFVLLVCAFLIHWRFPKAVYPDRPA
jgi:membrane protease YdiL (CAAX protease family)